MDSKRSLTRKELEYAANHLSEFSDVEDPFSYGLSDNYVPESEEENDRDIRKVQLPETVTEVTEDEMGDLEEEGNHTSPDEVDNQGDANFILEWIVPSDNFIPAKILLHERICKISENITRDMSPMQIFHKIFPHSLYSHIVKYINQRLEIMNKGKKYKQKLTDKGEIKKLLGCIFIMSYNRLPVLKHYWSSKESLGNQAIQKALSRDRFMILASKLYFAPPEKPTNSTKTYYVNGLLSCLKYTFSTCRQDSVYQSIDESMTKFKGRSSLKQYIPLKPTRRGIKLWLRCDADSGYTYI